MGKEKGCSDKEEETLVEKHGFDDVMKAFLAVKPKKKVPSDKGKTSREKKKEQKNGAG